MVFERPLKTNLKANLFVSGITDAFDLPFEEAIAYFRDKANVTSRHWYDVSRASASRAFWVAGAASDALVEDFRQAIDKAIAQGTTLQEFRKDFDRIVATHGWSDWTGEGSAKGRAWRQDIIYDTNLRAAYAAGRYAASMRPQTLHLFPYWQYHHSGSLHPRHEHLSWDGKIWRADDPFWITNYPTNGWHCGCYVTPVSEYELKRQGKDAPDPSPDLLPIITEVGGQKVTTIKGVDAGFDYNVGREWLSRTAPGRETMAASPGIIERFAEAAFAQKIDKRTHTPVALATRKIADIFGLPVGTELRLSAQTIQQHLHHPEALPIIYAQLIEHAVSEGTFLRNHDGRVSTFVYYGGAYWRIGIKSTNANELYVTTVHRSTLTKFKNAKKRWENL